MSTFPMRNIGNSDNFEERTNQLKVLQEKLNTIECDEYEFEENETVEETSKFILSSIFVSNDENTTILLREISYMMTIRPKLIKSYAELLRTLYKSKEHEKVHRIFLSIISRLSHKDSIFLGAVCILKELFLQNVITIDQLMDICMAIKNEQVHALIYFSCMERLETINLKTLETICSHFNNNSFPQWDSMKKILKNAKSIDDLFIYPIEIYPPKTAPYLIKIDACAGLCEFFENQQDGFDINGIVEGTLFEPCSLAYNSTYLQFALLYNSINCAKWLIENNADKTKCLKYAAAGGCQSLLPLFDCNEDDLHCALVAAVEFRRNEICTWLLEKSDDLNFEYVSSSFYSNNFTSIHRFIGNDEFISIIKQQKIKLLRDAITREDKMIIPFIIYFIGGITQDDLTYLKSALDLHKEFRPILQRYSRK